MISLQKNKPLFHKYLVKNLEDIREKKIKQDYDWFQVISGREGSGKSTLGIQVCSFIDPTFNINQICMDTDEFVRVLKDSKKQQAVMLDEAGTVLYSREAMTNINRLLTKAFMVIRAKNLFVCIVLPSFFLLDSYIRNHRVNCLIYINRRGNFKMFSSKRTKILSIKGMKYKSYDVVRESYQGYFTKKFPNPELEKQYHIKKMKYVNTFLRDMQREREGFYKVHCFVVFFLFFEKLSNHLLI